MFIHTFDEWSANGNLMPWTRIKKFFASLSTRLLADSKKASSKNGEILMHSPEITKDCSEQVSDPANSSRPSFCANVTIAHKKWILNFVKYALNEKQWVMHCENDFYNEKVSRTRKSRVESCRMSNDAWHAFQRVGKKKKVRRKSLSAFWWSSMRTLGKLSV